MRSRAYINERGEELIDIVEVFVYHIWFFGPFTPSLKPTVLEQIQRLATVSYDHGWKKYIWEHNVTEHCYLNYLLYKKNNMIRMGENWWTWPSDTSTYKNLTYEFFRSNVYIRDELYTQSVKRLQDILQK
jgi:hypothetical protein